MSKIKYLLLILGLVTGLGLAVMPMNVSAATGSVIKNQCPAGSTDPLCAHKNDNVMSSVKVIVNTLLYVLGAVAVIMIILGGIRYTISMGDAKNVEAAKNTILYSVVGLVVALLAYAIVNFVLSKIK
jgi:hypothetical protein